MNKFEHEISIVGGGPSGSTAAVYLASNGFDVALLERKKFPREKLCGEFLSKEVIEILSELELIEIFNSYNPNKIKNFRFFNTKGNSVSSELGFSGYGLRRSLFDKMLLDKAEKAGAKIYQPAEVKNILHNNDYIINADYNGSEISVKSNLVIGAYGRRNNLDKILNRNFVNDLTKLNGIKFHINKTLLNNFNEEEIHIYAAEGLYCGVNCVDNNLVTLCFLEDRNENNVPVRHQLLKLKEENEAFNELVSNEFDKSIKDLSLYGTGNIYFGNRTIVENGIFMIGDAAGVIAPLAGDGIGMAMQSAILLSELIIEVKENKINRNELENIFSKKWIEKFRKRLLNAQLAQNIIMNNFYREVSFKLVKIFPRLLNYFIDSTREK